MQLNEGLCVQDGKELFWVEGNTVVDVQIRHGLLHGSNAEPLSVGLARISHHLLELGAIEQRARRYDSAIGYLERAVRENPDRRELHYRLGRLYLQLGREENGRRQLEIFRELEHGKLSSESKNNNQQPEHAPKGKLSR